MTPVGVNHEAKLLSGEKKKKKDWVPPSTDELKTNFDENDKAGIGIIVWNSLGEVMAALSEKVHKPPSIEILELLAAKYVVKFVQEL